MSQQQPYQAGDIVNGHRWNGSVWEPVTLAPPTGSPAAVPPPPGGGRPIWKRWWVWVIVVVGALIVIGSLGGRGGNSGSASSASSAPASSAVAEPSASTASTPPTSSSPASPASSAPAVTSPSPEPTSAEPAPEPDAAAWGPITAKGSGAKVITINKPDDRAAIVTLTHRGDSNFAVWTLDSSLKEQQLLVNTIGDYKGTVLMDPNSGDVTKRLKVEADGDWTITVQDFSKAPKAGTAMSGSGDAVFIYTGPAGVITANATGDSNFAVWAYGSQTDLLFNEIAPYKGENVVSEGPLVLAVTASAKWTMNVTP